MAKKPQLPLKLGFASQFDDLKIRNKVNYFLHLGKVSAIQYEYILS